MKNIALLLAAVLLASPALAQDRWDGQDKGKHIAASAVSSLTVESLFTQTLTPVQRFAVAMLPGLIKELADMRQGGSGFSGKDIVADLIGVSLNMAAFGIVVRPGYAGISLKF